MTAQPVPPLADKLDEIIDRLDLIHHRISDVREIVTLTRQEAMPIAFLLDDAIKAAKTEKDREHWRQIRNHLVVQLNTGLEPR